jgi:hypothetical protein
VSSCVGVFRGPRLRQNHRTEKIGFLTEPLKTEIHRIDEMVASVRHFHSEQQVAPNVMRFGLASSRSNAAMRTYASDDAPQKPGGRSSTKDTSKEYLAGSLKRSLERRRPIAGLAAAAVPIRSRRCVKLPTNIGEGLKSYFATAVVMVCFSATAELSPRSAHAHKAPSTILPSLGHRGYV